MTANYRESVVEKYLNEQVKARRGRTVKLRMRGWPDRLVLLPRVPIFLVETKRPKGSRYEPLQLRIHTVIRNMGHTVHVAHTKEQVDQLLAPYTNT